MRLRWKTHAEELHRESEERFLQVAENAQEWIWEIDNDGLYTYSSPVVERILGYSPEEIIGKKHFYDFFHPQDKDALKEAALQAFAKKEPFSRFVNKNVHKNGNEVIFETSGVPILNSKGELLGYRGVDIDITERRKMEDELKQERDTLEMVTQNIGAGVAIISKDYRTVWTNGVLKQIFGDVEGKICYSTYNKRSAICPKCGVREIFEEGKGQVVHEQVGEDAKGNTIWSQIIATPIRDKEEKIIGALELVVPITERKQMEEAVRESEERFRGIAERSFDAIATVDMKGTITYASPSVGKVLGYPQNEVIGKSFLEYFSPAKLSEATQLFTDLMQGKNLEGLQLELSKTDGTKATVEINASPIIMNGEVTGIQAVFRDITGRRKMENALRESEEKLRLTLESSPDAIILTDLGEM